MGLLRGICLFVLAAIGAGLVWNTSQPNHSAGRSNSASPVVHRAREHRRPVYPFSVIPGGVFSGAELRDALARDSAAAEHYKGFSPERAHVEIVPHDRLVHVSYRVGDQLYWTRKRILLHAGESILNDGRQQARTRCGNRISDTPQGRYRHEEPDEKAFDTDQGDERGGVRAHSGPFAGIIPGVSADSYLANFGPALVAGGSESNSAGSSTTTKGVGSPAGSGPGTQLSSGSESQPGNSKPLSTATQTPVSPPSVNGVPELFSPGPIAQKPEAGFTTHTDVPGHLPIPGSNVRGTPSSTVIPGIAANEATHLFGPANSVPTLSNLRYVGFDSPAAVAALVNRQPGSPHPEAAVQEVSQVQVPEPGTWIEGLFGMGLLATGLIHQRRLTA